MPLQWIQATSGASWIARQWHTSVVTPDGRIWVIGGYSGSCLNDVWYTTDGSSWTQATSAASWTKRWNHASVVTPDGKIWVLGGRDSADVCRNDVWYSTNGSSWTQATSSATWRARYGFACVATSQGKIWVLGGSDGSSNYLRDVWYSFNGSSWTQASSAGLTDRYGHTAVITSDGTIWVLGGYSGSRRNDVWYSTNGVSWNYATLAAPWTKRYFHTSVVTPDDKIWVIGGYDGSRRNDVWYSADGSTWTQATSEAEWPARLSHTSVATSDGRIWLIGGMTSSGRVNDVWYATAVESVAHTLTAATKQIVHNDYSLTLATRQVVSGRLNVPLRWVQKPSAPWAARRRHASTVTPDGKIWVIGGSVAAGDNGKDVWYTYDGNTWTQTTSNVPWGLRDGHTAVATPDGRLWVLGGKTSDVWYSYDGTSWTQATASAGWGTRSRHTSVVTPDGAIWVIGGSPAYLEYSNDVWYSYDGVTWTRATLAAPWDARAQHTSLVTPEGRIWVLGGRDSYGYFRDVWYSYDGKTWTQATANAAWGDRCDHASTITSDGRMWVIGGYTGSYRNDAWYSYDGTSWTQATASAPWNSRREHTAVAKGNEIYVLGGYDYSNLLNDVWVAEINAGTFATKLVVTTPVSTEAAVSIYINEPGVQKRFGVAKVTHRGHHIVRGNVTTYGRLPQQFGEALSYDYTLCVVESKFAVALDVYNDVSQDVAVQVGVYNQTEEEAAVRLSIGNSVETAGAVKIMVGDLAETTSSVRLAVYNLIETTAASKIAIGNSVETTGRTRLSISNTVSVSTAVKVSVWNTTAETFAVKIDVVPASRTVEYSYALNVKIGVPGVPASMQAATKQRVYNTKTSAYSTRQTIYTRVTYTAATQQRILAVSPWASSFALAVAVYNQQTAEGRVSVETVPTGKGEGVLEYTVIPPNTSACVDIAAGQGLVIERLPGIVKATYRGPDGPVELVANYAWQTGVELPVAFRWTPAGCALFVAKAKRAENNAPMLIGERIADIQTGNAQYKDVRVSVRAREDWELTQDIRTMDQDTLAFASQPSQAQVQLITPTIFPQGSLLSVYPYDGMEYCVYEGEDGWVKLDYDDSDWDEAVRVKPDGLADYVWSPDGSRFMYYREEIYPYKVQDAVYLWIISQDAVFTVYVNGVEVLQGAQSGYEYNWSCVFQDEPKPGLFGEGWNTLCIKAEATGSNPGVRYLLIGRSGISTYATAYSKAGDKVMGRKKPVWGAWKAVSGPVITVDPGKALRLRSPDGRPVRVLSWKDEEESIARVNLTPVGR